MKKFTQILGMIGLVGMGTGFFALLIGQRANIFITLHLLLGGGLALLGLLSNLAGLKAYFLKRAGKAYSAALAQILILGVIIFLLGWLSYQHDWVLDVTQNRIYALSDKTKEVLSQLPGEIKITAFIPSEGFDSERQLLKLYQRESDKIKLEIIDPDRHPEKAEAMGINSYGTIVFNYLGREIKAYEAREDRITNSLIKVSRKESWIIYFITGHGEADPEAEDKGGMSMMKQFLEDENYQVKKLLISSEGIPADARLIVIAGPRIPYQPVEIEAIDRYLGKGGDAIFLLDPAVLTNLEGLLKAYGAELPGGIVIDQVHYLGGMDAVGLTVVANRFDQEHEVTRGLKGKLCAFPRAQAIRIPREAVAGVEGIWTPLVYSSETSYLETNLKTLFESGRARQDPEDPKGPLLLVAAYSEQIQPQAWEENQRASEIRIALAGNSFFMRNMALEVYSNYFLSINLFNWASGESEQASIVPKTRKASRIFITSSQTQIIFYTSVLIIPEILCVIGLAVWWRRR